MKVEQFAKYTHRMGNLPFPQVFPCLPMTTQILFTFAECIESLRKIYFLDTPESNENLFSKLIISAKLTIISQAVTRRCSFKRVLLKISQILKGKYLCQSLFFNRVAGLGFNFIKKEKLFRTSFL